MKKLAYLVLIAFIPASIVFNTDAFSKLDKKASYYGAGLSFNLNSHSAELADMPEFDPGKSANANGSSKGFSLWACYEFPLFTSASLQLRGLYNYDRSQLTGNAPKGLLILTPDNEFVFSHSLKSNISGIRLEPLVKLYIWKNLSLLAGANAGISFRKSTEHTETITFAPNDPEMFGMSKMNHWSQESIGFQSALCGGLAYEFPLSKSTDHKLGFNFLYSYGYANIVDELSFLVKSFRFGITYAYASTSRSKTPPIPPPTNPETAKKLITQINIQEDPLDLNDFKNRLQKDSLKLSLLVQEGEREVSVIKVKKFKESRNIQQLNLIFFDENSWEIPKRYLTGEFSDTKSIKNPPESIAESMIRYYGQLEDLAKLMLENERSEITLIGYSAGINEEKSDSLAIKRALSIKNYLIKAYRIKESRITTKTGKHKINTDNLIREELEELRRVEIKFNLTDFPFESFAKYQIIPQSLKLKQKISSDKNYSNSSLYVNDIELNESEAEFSGIDSSFNLKLFNVISKDDLPDTLSIFSRAASSDMQKQTDFAIFSNTIKLPVDIEVYNTSLESNSGTFSLLLFNFDESILNEDSRNSIKEISSKIKPETIIEISGYTDELGDEEYNLRLSEKRAEFVADYLKKALNLKNKIVTIGKGESNTYDSSLPEGRFFNRRVVIELKSGK